MSSRESRAVVRSSARRRKSSKSRDPPYMSGLRIVLLGKSVSENSRVGNFLLGRAVFDSEAPPDVVERVGGRLKDRHVTTINSPQLLQSHLSLRQITQTVRECVYLSDPGPHVIILLLKHDQCSAEDQKCVEKVLDSFSEEIYQHTMVLTTQEPTETNDILQKIIQKCFNRHFSLQRSSSPDDLLHTFEDIVKMNDGRHLVCAEASQYFTMEQQAKRLSEGEKLNLVVCGSNGTLKSSISELILQQKDRRSGVDLHGRVISLVELPAVNRLSEEEVMRHTLRCLSLCDPGVHVFLIIIPDAPLTDEDKAEMEEIQRIFSSRINKHIMILIMQNSEHQTADLNEEIKTVIKSFGGRHHFFGPTTQVSTLMENVEKMLEENRGEFFSTESFLEAQIKKLMKYEEMKKKIHSQETLLLSQGSRENKDELRIVLLGKTGVGKSATANTILGRKVFTAETSHRSVTKESQRETSDINGRHVTVIDTPGLFDTELTNEEIQREISNCISMILPGPHVFIIVLNLGQRFTQEEATSVKIIQETFGEKSLMFTMVLFTRGDDLKDKTIDQYLGEPGFPLMNLIEACGNKYHVFNNNQTGDRTQVSDLLEKIDDMVKANGGSFYSCKMFRQMEREKQEQQMKILMDRVRETEEELNKLKEEKERMRIMMEEEQQNHDKERKRREEELKREIIEQEKHQRDIRDEMRKERETFKHEIEETRQEKENVKKEKENLQIRFDTEIERLMNRIENERQNHDKERKRREEEFNAKVEQYKTLMKEKEENDEKMCEEMKRERETFKHEMEEMRQEKEKIKTEKDQFQMEIKRLMNRIENERQNQETERKRREEEFNEREEQSKREMKEKEELMKNHDEERKRREEEFREVEERYKREMKEKEEQIRDEMKREREMLQNEMKEIRRENEIVKKEKENLQIRNDTEIERMMKTIENERKKREEEFNEREEQYKTLMKEKGLMKNLEEEKERNDEERKRREEYIREREERYKRELKEKEESEEKMREELKREREKQELEEKIRREEEDEKRREKEQRDCDEFNQRLKEERERMEREKEDLQSKHEAEKNKMKILMEKMNREREELMKKHEKEKERMKMMMEEEQQNIDKEIKRREEELKREIRELEKHQREIRDEMRKERETFKHEMEETRQEKEKITTEKEKVKTEYETKQMQREKQKEDERQKRQEEKKKEQEQQKSELHKKQQSPASDHTKSCGTEVEGANIMFNQHLNVVLVGKTRAGKSASGNTILGQQAFISKRSSVSVTRDVAVESGAVGGITVTVYDTPGLMDTHMSDEEIQQMINEKVLQKCESDLCVFLLVIKADRFTEEDSKTVEKIEELLGEQRMKKTWILFTRGDELEEENTTIKEFINETEALKNLVQKYDQRYHVFNNKKRGQNEQVKMLLINIFKPYFDILEGEVAETLKPNPLMRRIPDNIEPDAPADSLSSRRIVLLGKSGVGKSATGNTILGQREFNSVMSTSSVTSVCSEKHATVSGRSVSVVDTPGLFDTQMKPEELMMEIARSVYISSPGPHAFLFVFRVNDRVTEQDQQIPQMIEMMFGEEVLKYSIILFTHGDLLDGVSVEKLIEENSTLRDVVGQCGGRFHIFNNRDMNNRQQVNDLLKKIDTMIEQNGGGHYRNQMLEDAERFRREEEERKQQNKGCVCS